MAGGLNKVSESVWQHGTALYYTMQLPDFRPFPWLSDLLSSGRVVLALVTYTALLVQLFFGPMLLHPVTRRIVVALALVVNVLFAVVFALPWTSLALLAVTLLFAPAGAFVWVDERVRHLLQPAGDWLAIRGYDVLDALDAVRSRLFYPVVDWFRITVLRR
jgi:hypothetical protein